MTRRETTQLWVFGPVPDDPPPSLPEEAPPAPLFSCERSRSAGTPRKTGKPPKGGTPSRVHTAPPLFPPNITEKGEKRHEAQQQEWQKQLQEQQQERQKQLEEQQQGWQEQ
eukprot:gene3788-62020_t